MKANISQYNGYELNISQNNKQIKITCLYNCDYSHEEIREHLANVEIFY